jgi:hypothetical protein
LGTRCWDSTHTRLSLVYCNLSIVFSLFLAPQKPHWSCPKRLMKPHVSMLSNICTKVNKWIYFIYISICLEEKKYVVAYNFGLKMYKS